MSKIKVKPEYQNKVFGFNNSAKPLGQRDDLHLLLKDAKANNVKHILDMFEEVPDDQVILEAHGDEFMNREKYTNLQTKQEEDSE